MTTAHCLGETAHMSPLRRRARRLGVGDLESLIGLAVKRGCSHYAAAGRPPPDCDDQAITNEELVSPCQPRPAKAGQACALPHWSRFVSDRSALALGYPEGDQFAVTMDVDGILPETEMAAIEADEQFWAAVDTTNRELESSGLYITHLFSDHQVILRPDWLDHVVGISCGLTKPAIFRPHVLDLISRRRPTAD